MTKVVVPIPTETPRDKVVNEGLLCCPVCNGLLMLLARCYRCSRCSFLALRGMRSAASGRRRFLTRAA